MQNSQSRAAGTRRCICEIGTLSFRGDAKHRTTMCNCTSENLEIPGPRFAHPGMTETDPAPAWLMTSCEARPLKVEPQAPVRFSQRRFGLSPGVRRQQIHCRSSIGRLLRCYFRDSLDTCPARQHVLSSEAVGGTMVSADTRGMGDMRQLGSLLSSAPSRIRRRLALIVAIAAASLPAAGA
jgi:hypothetical protein